VNAVLADPAVKAKLIDLGGEPLIGPPEAFGKMVAAETEKWEKVVKAANLKVE
jgi:tripartite-type tricarboxylate transporter receptor subunit TctC